MGSAGLGIFLPLLPDTGVFLLCLAFSAMGGLIPATLLSGAPLAAPAASLTPIVLGLVMQGNNLGQIAGPVAVGRAIDAYGWHAAALIVTMAALLAAAARSEEHTAELKSLLRITYAVLRWSNKKVHNHI